MMRKGSTLFIKPKIWFPYVAVIVALIMTPFALAEDPSMLVEERAVEENDVDPGRIMLWGRLPAGEFSGRIIAARLLINGRFIEISTGKAGHTFGIESDSSVWGWGTKEDDGATEIPRGKFKSVSTLGRHAIALDANNHIHVWGTDNEQILNHPSGKFKRIAAGGTSGYGIDMEGHLHAWGRDFYGNVKSAPEGIFRLVDAYTDSAAAIDKDGHIHEWGQEHKYKHSGTEPAPEGKFVDISVGRFHSVAIDTQGKLHSWGSTHHDLVNLHDVPDGEFVAVAAGGNFSMAVDSDGHLHVWGINDRIAVVREAPRGRVLAISAGRRHAAAILDPRDREDQP